MRLLGDLNEGKRPLDPANGELLHLLLEGFRTIWEAFLIAHTLTSRRKDHLFTSTQLSALVRGAESSRGEGNAQPRSIQLEMLAATKLVLGGADVTMDEPDITFLYHGDYLGGAVKRITRHRPRTVEKAVRSATRQFRANDCPGFIILSVDPFVEEIGTRLPAQDFGEAFSSRLTDVYARAEDVAADKPELVLGAIILAHDSRWNLEDGTPRLEWAEATQFLRFSEAPDEVSKAKEFFGPLGDRMWHGLEDAVDLLVRPRGPVDDSTPHG